MASCRVGRIPLPSDPIQNQYCINALNKELVKTGIWASLIGLTVYLRWTTPVRICQDRGPEDPTQRPRKKKFSSGGPFFGWGNNGLNRDCSLLEYECWAGYVGRSFKY
ncbi:short-chain dehydrogenase/reductase family 42E member 1-like protein [Perkinsela sp. CCAP 1560/4]|nr:short-chain dehydrogenase/reductase family 42E member 1-like protein [Perkinsela sp. CCAP 1560/4]|eukprot:KNH09236.1 short-chain dehydrogenase/reductase family 42E member 1-like protein [Perkinsela sp. CCAP 1560/4]